MAFPSGASAAPQPAVAHSLGRARRGIPKSIGPITAGALVATVGGCEEPPQRAPAGRLARPGAEAGLDWRQGGTAGHQQTRRYVPERLVGFLGHGDNLTALQRGANINQILRLLHLHERALAAPVYARDVSTVHLLLTHGSDIAVALSSGRQIPDLLR